MKPISCGNKNISKPRTGFGDIWCERWDSNPHGETTRTSNVLVYHSNTLASALVLYRTLAVLSMIIYHVDILVLAGYIGCRCNGLGGENYGIQGLFY